MKKGGDFSDQVHRRGSSFARAASPASDTTDAVPREGTAVTSAQSPSEFMQRPLRRVFAIAPEHCQNCHGGMKIIAAIVEAPVINGIPTDLASVCFGK